MDQSKSHRRCALTFPPLPSTEQRACHHRIVWADGWPPPDETLLTCTKCHVTLLWADGFLSIRDEYGEF
jgi:hypothetical protein